MSKQKLDIVYHEATERLNIADGVLDAEGSATITSKYSGVPQVYLNYDGENDILTLISQIGYIPEDDSGLYREFLGDNFMLNATRGAVFSISDERGCLVLHRELEVELLNGERLAVAISNMMEVGYRARRRLRRSVEPEELPAGMMEERANGIAI